MDHYLTVMFVMQIHFSTRFTELYVRGYEICLQINLTNFARVSKIKIPPRFFFSSRSGHESQIGYFNVVELAL